MAQFCVEIPDDKLNEVLTAMGAQYRYQETVTNPDFNAELPEDPDTNPSTIERQKALAELLKVGVAGTGFIEWTIKQSNNISDMYDHLMRNYLRNKFLAKNEISFFPSRFIP